MPQKRYVNLAEFLERSYATGFFEFRIRGWFEDADFIFHPDYDEEGAHLTFAQSKEMYFVQPRFTSDYYLDLEEVKFDSRFIFPELFKGTLYFGNYQDDELGRIFFLTEPKGASEMLLLVTETSGICEWLKDDPNVKYFRHEDRRFNLCAVLPVGSRLDFDHELVITDPTSTAKDRALFTQLFQEKLRCTVDLDARETTYVRPLVEIEQESKAHREDYADRLDALSEKFREICRIRRIVASSPFDDPVSVCYKDHNYFYNNDNMSQLETVVRNDYEFYQNLEKRLDFVESLIKNGLADICAEFDVEVSLKLDRTIRLADISEEVIVLSVFPVASPPKHSHIIHQHSVDLYDFNVPTEGGIAETFVLNTKQFFDRYREKFHAFKKLYETNLHFYELADHSTHLPQFDYSYIFSDLDF